MKKVLEPIVSMLGLIACFIFDLFVISILSSPFKNNKANNQNDENWIIKRNPTLNFFNRNVKKNRSTTNNPAKRELIQKLNKVNTHTFLLCIKEKQAAKRLGQPMPYRAYHPIQYL